MRAAILTVRIWCEPDAEAQLPDSTGEVAELLPEHLDHISGLCQQGYIAGQVVDENFTGWWELKEDN